MYIVHIYTYFRAVLDYIELKEGGEEILQLPVNRLFPSDIQVGKNVKTVVPLECRLCINDGGGDVVMSPPPSILKFLFVSNILE